MQIAARDVKGGPEAPQSRRCSVPVIGQTVLEQEKTMWINTSSHATARRGHLRAGLLHLAICAGLFWPASAATALPFVGVSVDAPALPLVLAQQSETDEAETIRSIQRRLQALGLYNGAIDGVWGQGTNQALRRFYAIAGLSGQLDYEKAVLLYWASQIAGARSVSAEQAIREAPALVQAEEDRDRAAGLAQAGRYEDAERLYASSTEVQERLLGADHPETLVSKMGLAAVYRGQGRLDESSSLQAYVFHTMNHVLGEYHPYTLMSMNNLANVYWDTGRMSEAEDLLSRLVSVLEITKGDADSGTLNARNNLAGIYSDQGRLAEAEALFAQVLEMRERTLGADHPHTLTSVYDLAVVFYRQSRFSEAERFAKRALESRERVIGKDHRDTIVNIGLLASIYEGQGRTAEANLLRSRLSR